MKRIVACSDAQGRRAELELEGPGTPYGCWVLQPSCPWWEQPCPTICLTGSQVRELLIKLLELYP